MLNYQTIREKQYKLQIQNFNRSSINDVTIELTRHLLALLRNEPCDLMETVLIDRVPGGEEQQKTTIVAKTTTPSGEEIPIFDDIRFLDPQQRLTLLLDVFGTQPEEFQVLAKELEQVEIATDRDQLLVNSLVMRYFFRTHEAPPSFFVALAIQLHRHLVLKNIIGHDQLAMFDKLRGKRKIVPEPDLIHNYSQYQGLLTVYRQLTTLMLRPLPDILPHKYMNGIAVYKLQMELKSGNRQLSRYPPQLVQVLRRRPAAKYALNAILKFVMGDSFVPS